MNGVTRAISRRFALALALTGLVALPGRAEALDSAAVIAPIEALNNGLVAVMRAGQRTPFLKRFQMLEPVVERAFDLPTILRTSVGLSWSGIDPALQATLLQAFRRFTIASYVANFDSANGQRFEIAPALRVSGADQVVATTIVSVKGSANRIDYVMRQEGTTWKAIDVLLDGTISRVAVQRSDFRSVLAHGGAAALIVSLQAKVVDLAGSALAS